MTVLLLLACAPSVPLDEVPIRRGTAEQCEAVERAFAEFEAQTGGGRVEIRKIVFDRGDYSGQYDSAARVIRLHEEIPVHLVPKVVRHELCHALDFQEGLLERRGTPIDAWVDVLLDEEAGLVEERIHRPRRQRSEAFALWCGEGPLHAALLSESCSDEPPEVTEVAAWLTEVVWTGYALPTLEETPAPMASWVALFEPVAVYANATTNPSVISLSLVAAAEGGGSEHQWAYLDLHSGAWLAPIPGVLVVSDYEPFPVDLGDLHVYNTVGTASGEAGARVGIDYFLGERQADRALYWDGETLFHAGCTPLIREVLATEDRVWGLWLEGTTVRWAPLGDSASHQRPRRASNGAAALGRAASASNSSSCDTSSLRGQVPGAGFPEIACSGREDPMSSEQLALEAALRRSPEDWQTWLAYADWLTAHADIRGQLVVWEHQLATATLVAEERHALRQQADVLVAAHRDAWLLGFTPPEQARLHWRHGFVVGIWLPWNNDTLAVLDALVAHSAGRLFTELNLADNGIDADGARALASSEALSSMTSLDLGVNALGDEGARAVATSPSLRLLTELDLRLNGVGPDGARALGSSEILRWVKRLHLWKNRLGDEGVSALASSEALGSLSSLHLGGNDLGDEGIRALAASKALRSLIELDLWDNHIGAEGIQALASSGVLGSVTELNLGHNDLGTAGAQALALSEMLHALTSLRLGGNHSGDAGARALAMSTSLRSLTSLDLDSNDIGADGAQALASSEALGSLTTLDLMINHIGDDGACALAASTTLRSLTALNLGCNGIGDAGALALASASALGSLHRLGLWINDIGDAGVVAVASMGSLTWLAIASNPIGDSGMRALGEAAQRGCEVHTGKE